MKRLSRPTALKIAAVYNFLMGSLGFFTSIPFLALGANALNHSGNTAPYFVFILGLMRAPIQIIGAYGTWRNQRWGVVLLILTSAIDLISALPGMLFAPTLFLRLLSESAIQQEGGAILLCLWREPRQSSTISLTVDRKQ